MKHNTSVVWSDYLHINHISSSHGIDLRHSYDERHGSISNAYREGLLCEKWFSNVVLFFYMTYICIFMLTTGPILKIDRIYFFFILLSASNKQYESLAMSQSLSKCIKQEPKQ